MANLTDTFQDGLPRDGEWRDFSGRVRVTADGVVEYEDVRVTRHHPLEEASEARRQRIASLRGKYRGRLSSVAEVLADRACNCQNDE